MRYLSRKSASWDSRQTIILARFLHDLFRLILQVLGVCLAAALEMAEIPKPVKGLYLYYCSNHFTQKDAPSYIR